MGWRLHKRAEPRGPNLFASRLEGPGQVRTKVETELPKGTNGIVSALATYLTCIFQSFEGLSQVILGRTRIY